MFHSMPAHALSEQLTEVIQVLCAAAAAATSLLLLPLPPWRRTPEAIAGQH